ncbi:steroid receptor RNA activator 1 isoform X1 [Oncorhynchus mykiss]|uniref:steroid receptor RNA activator 1 isoform X1 n=1 Tax=Oncorhynchus mykiss TaxID=8022 RepID=UPI001877C7EE|nr:steroid receptor RNA activator 1 isoform X1 [Oncorhynchus mykiss]
MEAKDLYIKPGNQERGWNDPPQFSYGLQTAAQGAPKRTPLNKRVPPPQLTGSPCPVPGDFPSATAPMTPPTNPLAPPCSMNTPPRPCPVAAPPLGGVMATPPPPFPVVEHTDSASSQSENEPDVDDVVTLLNWALTACRHTVKKQVCNDVAKRLKLFEDMWKSGKLSLPVRRRMIGLVQGGKTRTKDKYRVVYTDHQRLELEKEFHYSRYITIRRKAELATSLSLSERQVKIWFQNRRAKERKVNKKKMQQPQPASTTTPTPPGSSMPGNVAMVTSSSGGLVSPSIPMTIKEEY